MRAPPARPRAARSCHVEVEEEHQVDGAAARHPQVRQALAAIASAATAGVSTAAAAPAAEAPPMDDTDDVEALAHRLAARLAELPTIEAVGVTADLATSDSARERLVLAGALAWVFPLASDDVVLSHLGLSESTLPEPNRRKMVPPRIPAIVAGSDE